MYMCLDCKSSNVVETSDYSVYFREDQWVRQRTITVYQNLNHSPFEYIAFCPELSITAMASGETELNAILNLAKVLKGLHNVEMISKNMAFYDE